MLGDTILAQASPDGPAERAILRISGPAARAVADLVFEPALPAARGQLEGRVRVRGRAVEALALVMPGPRSFTGEDTVELHLPGSPLLCSALRDDLLTRAEARGLRAAVPGEFTARACTNGRLDFAQAEGILMLLHAADRSEVAAGAQWLQGGMSAALTQLRGDLHDVLALLESGLDFTEGETGTVAIGDVDRPLGAIAGRVDTLLAGLPAAVPGGEVLLLGAANVGKSSLCNALAGNPAMLVDGTAGTTRDLVRVEVEPGVALWDAPGDLDDPAEWDAAALQLRDRIAGPTAAALLVIDAAAPMVPQSVPRAVGELPRLAIVLTRCDLEATPVVPAGLPDDLPVVHTSAVDGRGLDELRALLRRSVRAGTADAGGPVREQLRAVAEAVGRASAAMAAGAELAAIELQMALRALDGRLVGHSAEDLLERIYGRFCLGK